MQVDLVCQFGKPTRGVSPYADALIAALREHPDLQVKAVDFRSAYPGILHPARSTEAASGQLSWYDPFSWFRVARSSADILHLQHWAPPLASYLWPVVKMAKHAGTKIVITVHNPLPHERAGAFDGMECRMYRSADALISHGKYGRLALQQRLGTNAPPVVVIPHGMEIVDKSVTASPARRVSAGLNVEYRHILLFGNLRPYKGIDTLLQAWEHARPSVPGVRLVIAGQLWNKSNRSLARMAGLVSGTQSRASLQINPNRLPEDVILREGFMDDDALDNLIKACDLLVFPYRHFSGQSGAACRAAAMGKPILVSQTGALPELAIDGSWTFPPSDVGALSDALVEKIMAIDRAQDIGQKQLDAVRHCSWNSVGAAHSDLYRKLG